MLTTAFLFLLSGLFLSLRLGEGSGSFPRPLGAEEERQAVEAWTERGELEARNLLVEHNLRLVAHIIKKGESKGKPFPGGIAAPLSSRPGSAGKDAAPAPRCPAGS